ncbi:MAG: glycosyltransferase family 4 protein [Porticoccaceae bacterium]|nr:glycosyltransferase family 4 protein [Porticoccaceae bacterium]
MNILLSAYACEPNKGSEPGVGWNWAIELAKLGHQVHVITRANNKRSIIAALSEAPCDNLHFTYYDLPDWLKSWKKGARGVHLYYFLWQIGIYSVAKRLVKKHSFDVIHHVTFVSVRQPSFLGLLGVPFIFGPVGGGERTPFRLRKSYPPRGCLIDAIRDLANLWVKFSPLMRMTFHTATKIYVTSEDTCHLIPKKFHNKTSVQLGIALDISPQKPIKKFEIWPEPRVLYVGNLLYWKGVHLALRSFSLLLKHLPESRLTILGKGPDKLWLKNLSCQLGIEHAVEWLEWMPRGGLDEVYQGHDVLLFPSLHDSGGMVVLEAMGNGLPVICLSLGGPGVIVDETCGYTIDTNGCTELQVVKKLGDALKKHLGSSKLNGELSEGVLRRAKQLSWANQVFTVYDKINGSMK